LQSNDSVKMTEKTISGLVDAINRATENERQAFAQLVAIQTRLEEFQKNFDSFKTEDWTEFKRLVNSHEEYVNKQKGYIPVLCFLASIIGGYISK
jgi:hypothetical protein